MILYVFAIRNLPYFSIAKTDFTAYNIKEHLIYSVPQNLVFSIDYE